VGRGPAAAASDPRPVDKPAVPDNPQETNYLARGLRVGELWCRVCLTAGAHPRAAARRVQRTVRFAVGQAPSYANDVDRSG
jgi:hypothetical protein